MVYIEQSKKYIAMVLRIQGDRAKGDFKIVSLLLINYYIDIWNKTYITFGKRIPTRYNFYVWTLFINMIMWLKYVN